MKPRWAHQLKAIKQSFRARPGHALAWLFVITVLLPGLLLAIFGMRALRQERSRADQEIKERLGRAAEAAADALERQFRDWQQTVDQLPAAGIDDPARIPIRIRQALEEPGPGILITRNGAGSTFGIHLPQASPRRTQKK